MKLTEILAQFMPPMEADHWAFYAYNQNTRYGRKALMPTSAGLFSCEQLAGTGLLHVQYLS